MSRFDVHPCRLALLVASAFVLGAAADARAGFVVHAPGGVDSTSDRDADSQRQRRLIWPGGFGDLAWNGSRPHQTTAGQGGSSKHGSRGATGWSIHSFLGDASHWRPSWDSDKDDRGDAFKWYGRLPDQGDYNSPWLKRIARHDFHWPAKGAGNDSERDHHKWFYDHGRDWSDADHPAWGGHGHERSDRCVWGPRCGWGDDDDGHGHWPRLDCDFDWRPPQRWCDHNHTPYCERDRCDHFVWCDKHQGGCEPDCDEHQHHPCDEDWSALCHRDDRWDRHCRHHWHWCHPCDCDHHDHCPVPVPSTLALSLCGAGCGGLYGAFCRKVSRRNTGPRNCDAG
ncbi:MAG: hypothetical protein ACT4QC_13830 [Planctomycetaceae bacterium]